MEQKSNLKDADKRRFGTGWISGILGLFLAAAGLATVACFLFPQTLTVDQARDFYVANHVWIRVLLSAVLISGFFLGLINIVLGKHRKMGFLTLGLVMLATLMGGSHASQVTEKDTFLYFGLDFFLLNLVFFGGVFIPLERIFKKVDQPILRYEWREDLLYFFVSTLFVQSLTYLSLNPSLAALGATQWASGIRGVVASQPLVLQFFTSCS